MQSLLLDHCWIGWSLGEEAIITAVGPSTGVSVMLALKPVGPPTGVPVTLASELVWACGATKNTPESPWMSLRACSHCCWIGWSLGEEVMITAVGPSTGVSVMLTSKPVWACGATKNTSKSQWTSLRTCSYCCWIGWSLDEKAMMTTEWDLQLEFQWHWPQNLCGHVGPSKIPLSLLDLNIGNRSFGIISKILSHCYELAWLPLHIK